jgi:hypothetical protein
MNREPLIKIRPARPYTSMHYRAMVPIQHWGGIRKGTYLRRGNEVFLVAQDALEYVGVMKVIRA